MNFSTKYITDQIAQIEKKIQETKELIESHVAGETMLKMVKDELINLENQKDNLTSALAEIESGSTSASVHKDKGGANKDSASDKDGCIIEIRAGTGGDEAGLFATDLYNMYSKFAEKSKWKNILISKNEGGIGNLKEVAFELKKDSGSKEDPYESLQFESGVHRVQRVPVTESGGRIHTSTATVAVLPIVGDKEIEIRPEDIRVDTYRSGGAGGQNVNKVESAIRITHLSTGLVVTCQDERSQHKNRERAMSVLRSKLYEMMKRQNKDNIADLRAGQVGTGDRNEKIRTYNYPQDRITDHRIKHSWFGIERLVKNGEIDKIIGEVKKELDSLTA